MHNFTQSGWLILFIPEHLSGQHKVGKSRQTFSLAEQLVQCRHLSGCSQIAAAAAWTQWGKLSNLWTPGVYFLDQGIQVEYELDKFNTPHTGTILRHPQNWLCRLWCWIPLRHLATTSPLGNIFWRHSRFSPKQPEPQTNGDFNVYFLKRQIWLLLHTANIIPRMFNDTRCYLNSFITSNHSLLSFPMKLAAQTQAKYSMLPLKTFM